MDEIKEGEEEEKGEEEDIALIIKRNYLYIDYELDKE